MSDFTPRQPWRIDERMITEPEHYAQRREFLKAAGWTALAGSSWPGIANVGPVADRTQALSPSDPAALAQRIRFLEFSPWPDEAMKLAERLDTTSWQLTIGGEVERSRNIDVAALIATMPVETRVYRFRSMQGWAAVVPWQGFPMRRLLALARPTSAARFVCLTSIAEPECVSREAEGGWYQWPYQEALSIAEAAHELTLVATGMYGQPLAPVHGAPLRLVVPWKYGLKSIKSIVHIELTRNRPATFWTSARPEEYDFECNVDPTTAHARWPQHEELMLGTGERRATEPYNGYGRLVASLYE